MATNKSEEVNVLLDGNEDDGEEKYVTRSELMDVLKEFFGDRDDNDDDVIDLDDKEKNDDLLGVYSAKEIEKLIEKKVAAMTKSLSASKPKSSPKPKVDAVIEEKPVTPDMRGVAERIKAKLWGE